jgi:integrase
VELSKIQYLTESQSQAFIQAASKDRLEALYVLAITTGMRQGEMLGLRWGDVDFVGRKLTISRALHRTRRPKAEGDPDQEWFTMRAPKTRGSRRTIELPLVTIEALERHRRAQQADPSVASDLMTRDSIARDLVFATRSGRPLDTSNVLHHFQRLLKNAGLPQIRFYDLRHTHASLLIAQGVHPKKIAERLGHASIKLTMDTYGHLFDGSDRESAERMQKLFGEALKAPSHEPGKVVSLDSHRRRSL